LFQSMKGPIRSHLHPFKIGNYSIGFDGTNIGIKAFLALATKASDREFKVWSNHHY